MLTCIKCGSQNAWWSICNKENNMEYYCDPCFQEYNLFEYKKEMDEYHEKIRQIKQKEQQNAVQKENEKAEVGGNLPPWSIVPKSGKWQCEGCGQGALAQVLAGMGDAFGMFGMLQAKKEGTVCYFQGETFPSCPNCKMAKGDLTGWSLVD